MTPDEARRVERFREEHPGRLRDGCPDLSPEWPGLDGRPRGPVLCVCYPHCECGEEDLKLIDGEP